MKKFIVTLVVFLLAQSGVVINAAHAEREDRMILGAGALIATSPYKGEDTNFYPVPIIVVDYENWFIDGKRGGYVVYDEDSVRFDAFLAPRLMGYDNSDSSPVLDGMKDREFSVDAGVQLELTSEELFDLNLITSFTTDALSEHDGHEIKAGFSKLFKGEIFEFTPEGGVKWQSENMTNYYYGVRRSERITNRPEYNPSDAVNYYLDLNLNLGLSEELILVTSAGFEWLDDEITDSSIVDEDILYTWVVGIAKRF